MKESPLYAKSYDFIRWLIPRTLKFPRGQRFVVAARLQDAALNFMETLYFAGASDNKLAALKRADSFLKQVRFYLRLSQDLRLITPEQYAHASRLVEEIGRLLGAWIKSNRSRAEATNQES